MKPRIRFMRQSNEYRCQHSHRQWAGFGKTPEAAYQHYRQANAICSSHELYSLAA